LSGAPSRKWDAEPGSDPGDGGLYCFRRPTNRTPYSVAVVLLHGWAEDKKGKTEREDREEARALNLCRFRAEISGADHLSFFMHSAADGADIEVPEESALAMAQSVIQNAIDESGPSRAEAALRMERNRSFISRMSSGSVGVRGRGLRRRLSSRRRFRLHDLLRSHVGFQQILLSRHHGRVVPSQVPATRRLPPVFTVE
jgi:hypothetical protein